MTRAGTNARMPWWDVAAPATCPHRSLPARRGHGSPARSLDLRRAARVRRRRCRRRCRSYLSSSFSDLPALNFADFDAGMSMFSPVLGLRPVRGRGARRGAAGARFGGRRAIGLWASATSGWGRRTAGVSAGKRATGGRGLNSSRTDQPAAAGGAGTSVGSPRWLKSFGGRRGVPTRNPSAIMPPAVRSDDGVRRPPAWR
jgi:hypothetical protein